MRTAVRQARGLLLLLALSPAATACGATPPPPEPDDTIHSYVALGDGFTAAPYAGRSTDEACRRSEDNYPALVARELGIGEVKDVSCTGATTSAITDPARPADREEKVAAQLDAVSRDTDLVTLGVGIEDRDLLQHMFTMCTTVVCGSKVPPATVAQDLEEIGASVTRTVRAIQDKAPNAYIVLVGYPEIVPRKGRCAALPDLDKAGLELARSIVPKLNRLIQSSARQTGSAFLDLEALSAGHELCSSTPWVTGSKAERGKSVPFHPVAAEQRAVADALVDLVKTR